MIRKPALRKVTGKTERIVRSRLVSALTLRATISWAGTGLKRRATTAIPSITTWSIGITPTDSGVPFLSGRAILRFAAALMRLRRVPAVVLMFRPVYRNQALAGIWERT